MEYVLTFIFTPDFKKVWLIEKQIPLRQNGCLNGIGGKIEENEDPKDAALRELYEEAGVELSSYLNYVGIIKGLNNDNTNFKVHIFCETTSKVLKTMEEEQIFLIPINEIKKYKHIENVPTLIESCIYYMTGHSNFKKIIMEY